MLKEHADALLVSPLKIDDFNKNEEFKTALLDNGIKVFIMKMSHLWDGKSDLRSSELQEVQIEDLLPRDEIEVNMQEIEEMLKGKCIMVTGSAGSIGSEMVRQIASFGPSQMVLIDEAETPQHDIRLMMKRDFPEVPAYIIVTSITKLRRMESLFAQFKPDYVFHAAAYKHVPMMEDNPSEAVQNNVDGTRIIADLAVKYGVKKFVARLSQATGGQLGPDRRARPAAAISGPGHPRSRRRPVEVEHRRLLPYPQGVAAGPGAGGLRRFRARRRIDAGGLGQGGVPLPPRLSALGGRPPARLRGAGPWRLRASRD